MANKILVASVLVFLVAGAIIFFTQPQKEKDYEFSGPVETVQKYFESWNKGNWPDVYSVISDGFKKINPTAKTLSDFRFYAEAQNVTEVEVISIKEKSNDGKIAVIDYSVEFIFSDNTKRPFSDTFILKWREADIIKGWKIIKPYGENADTS